VLPSGEKAVEFFNFFKYYFQKILRIFLIFTLSCTCATKCYFKILPPRFIRFDTLYLAKRYYSKLSSIRTRLNNAMRRAVSTRQLRFSCQSRTHRPIAAAREEYTGLRLMRLAARIVQLPRHCRDAEQI